MEIEDIKVYEKGDIVIRYRDYSSLGQIKIIEHILKEVKKDLDKPHAKLK
jgi:hypothetical protein